MYLELKIADENGVTKEVTICRDGSDSEALDSIEKFLADLAGPSPDIFEVTDYDTSEY